ncbi:cellulase family glycosylhydrolase [Amycolatopsis magusensis]|uniref:cellulase family glycosylhydrolase n=1 Tax=Amycolatopsis magusensis TaxID=882444 RepID=UPI003C309FD4
MRKLLVAVLLVFAAVVVPSGSAPPPAAAATADWLHTEGNRIVDADGNEVWLTGANWFGFNAGERVFHGLWSANIEQVTRSMAERGINLVRVPISTQLLLEWKAGQAGQAGAVNTYVNPELTGKTTLEVFDHFLALCEKYGLKVMLDVHSAEADNSGHVQPVWWKGSITPELFYQGWEWVTARYEADDTIIAMDVKNEPHGTASTTPRAKWDSSTDQDNFKHACETAGKRILAINPNVLILCEGNEIYPKDGENWSSVTGTDYHGTWWGGNLRGARDHPVNLGANQDQLVYSPHDYGPLVFEQPWFKKEFDKTTLTDDVWRPNWFYLHENGTAPLLIGEWGGRLGQDARQDRWMTALRDLITENGLHQTFWCLNPNSGDTGGLLLDDWKTWDETKYALLKPALWQHGGKFVSLDHEVPLGGAGSTTGISLGERYGGGGGTDTEAPGVPGAVVSTATGSASVTLGWGAATDNVGVREYEVHRGGTKVGSSPGTSFTDTGLAPNTDYTYTVRARDAAGNVSAPSAPLTVRTSAAPPGSLQVLYRDNDASPADNAIRPGLQVVNTGQSTVDLKGVTVRYYFTRDGSGAVSSYCDWAATGCANLSTAVHVVTAVPGADAYLEVGFTTGTLAPGQSTGEIQLRLGKSDWSNFDETNDHSHGAAAAYTAAPQIPAYLGGTRTWGVEP